MNKLSRLFLACVSTLLLAAGLARAAERLDPLSNNSASLVSPLLPDEPCSPCMSCDRGAE